MTNSRRHLQAGPILCALTLALSPAAAPRARAQATVREVWAINWAGQTSEVLIDFQPYGVSFTHPINAHCDWVGAPHCSEGANDVWFSNPMDDGVTYLLFSGTLVINGVPTRVNGARIRRVGGPWD